MLTSAVLNLVLIPSHLSLPPVKRPSITGNFQEHSLETGSKLDEYRSALIASTEPSILQGSELTLADIESINLDFLLRDDTVMPSFQTDVLADSELGDDSMTADTMEMSLRNDATFADNCDDDSLTVESSPLFIHRLLSLCIAISIFIIILVCLVVSI